MVKIMNANKKILLSVVAFVLVVALGGVILFFLGSDNRKEPYVDEYGNVYYPDGYNDPDKTTSVNLPDSPAMGDIYMDAQERTAIEAFVSGCYYISMIDMSSPDQAQLDIAIRNEDFQMAAEVEGVKFEIMFLNSNLYLIDSEKRYIDMSSLSSLAGAEEAFDTESMKEVAAVLDVSQYNFHSVEKEDTTVDNSAAVCYKYISDDLELKFYFVASELRQIDFVAASDDGENLSIKVNQFLPYIPSDKLTVVGLKKTSILEFFKNLGVEFGAY